MVIKLNLTLTDKEIELIQSLTFDWDGSFRNDLECHPIELKILKDMGFITPVTPPNIYLSTYRITSIGRLILSEIKPA